MTTRAIYLARLKASTEAIGRAVGGLKGLGRIAPDAAQSKQAAGHAKALGDASSDLMALVSVPTPPPPPPAPPPPAPPPPAPPPPAPPPPAPPPPVPPPPAPPAPVVAAGTWQQLTVAPHSRKLVTESIATGTTFDPSIAMAVDARQPSTVSAIPYRSFCRPVMGEPGVLYVSGSLHSNYPGNEIDRIDLRDLSSTQITTTISHQPRVSPQGVDSGYGSGSGLYVFKQYGTPLADPGDWQPYAHHTWTKNGWHPAWGYYSQGTYALNNGATVGANPLGAGAQYQQSSLTDGVWSFDFAEGKYRVRMPTAQGPNFAHQGPGISGMSDWNQHSMSVLGLANYGGHTHVAEIVNNASTKTNVFSFNQATLSGTTWGWADSSSGNGVLVKWLEGSKYLCLRADFNKHSTDPASALQTLFLINLMDPVKARKLTPPAAPFAGITLIGDGNYTFCVDRNSRRIFWLVYSGNTAPNSVQSVAFYVSTFDAPTEWAPIETKGFPAITNTTYQASWLASIREPMHFYNGHLFVTQPEGGGPSNPGYCNGAMNIWRCKVDGGAALPAMDMKRLDYWAQSPVTNGFRFSNTRTANLQMIGTKHVNWAFDPAANIYRQHAGDFGMSTCQSMCTLSLDESARGYTFAEVLNETDNPAPGKFRPSSPDDGHWFHVPTDSAWIAGRGKFVWMRGGDGEPMFYNAELRRKYGATDSNGTAAQIAAAEADGWDIKSKFYVYDPATQATAKGFDRITGAGWTQDNGGTYWPSVWTASSASSRNGYFDPTTGCLWRFYNFGSMALARFDFQAQTVKVFNIANFVSDQTGRTISMDGLNPPSESVLVADGNRPKFCWNDTGAGRWRTFGEFSWEHKATWIDPATGYLYVVSPGTGYLFRFDTRGTHMATSNGYRLPLTTIGERIPLVGTYPTLNSRTTWPPVTFNGDVKMNSLLLPYKGGLLYLSSGHHDSGVSGEPHYAFWRALGDVGPWSVVTMPQEFAANAGAARNPYAPGAANDELLLISQAYTDLETRQFYRYFWRVR